MSPRGPGVVIDTNVWISGLLTKVGFPARLTRLAIGRGQLVFSTDTFAELKERLWRPKFDRYVTMEQRKALLADIEAVAFSIDVPPAIVARRFSRDVTDDKFIHAALAAKSSWLMTGDQDLLVLSESVLSLGVRIISPAEAMSLPEFSPFM